MLGNEVSRVLDNAGVSSVECECEWRPVAACSGISQVAGLVINELHSEERASQGIKL